MMILLNAVQSPRQQQIQHGQYTKYYKMSKYVCCLYSLFSLIISPHNIMHNFKHEIKLCLFCVSRVSQRLARVAGNDKCADCGDISK